MTCGEYTKHQNAGKVVFVPFIGIAADTFVFLFVSEMCVYALTYQKKMYVFMLFAAIGMFWGWCTRFSIVSVNNCIL